MTQRSVVTVDGNEAAASVAHRLSEVIAIYPIIPRRMKLILLARSSNNTNHRAAPGPSP